MRIFVWERVLVMVMWEVVGYRRVRGGGEGRVREVLLQVFVCEKGVGGFITASRSFGRQL